MDKNTFLFKQHLSKNKVALFFFATMMIGFLGARSIASVSLFLFGVNALRDIPPREWLRQKWWLLGLVWIGILAVSWFWSTNKTEWGAHFQVKLPFLILPLAFGFLPPGTTRQLQVFTWIFVGFITLGCLYSLSFFVRDPQAYIQGYSYSHTIPSPTYNYHIGFSTAVALCIGWCIYSLPLWARRTTRCIILAIALFLAVYLHILAAKTGLVAFYIFLIGYLVYLFCSISWKKGLLMLLIAGIGITAAYQFVPTFRTRIGYTTYTWMRYKEGERTGNYSDMGRVISYKIALRIISMHPLVGVGAGDMLDEMSAGYDRWYPQIPQEQRLIPHNQFLTHALATGIPSMLVFIIWILAPFRYIKRNREGAFFIITWLMLLVPLFTDPFLEVQFGVFVYLFFFLMQRSLIIPIRPIAQ